MKSTPEISEIPEAILNHPFVVSLLEKVESLSKQVEELEAVVRLLKSHPPKPVIPPSSNLEPSKSDTAMGSKKKLFH